MVQGSVFELRSNRVWASSVPLRVRLCRVSSGIAWMDSPSRMPAFDDDAPRPVPCGRGTGECTEQALPFPATLKTPATAKTKNQKLQLNSFNQPYLPLHCQPSTGIGVFQCIVLLRIVQRVLPASWSHTLVSAPPSSNVVMMAGLLLFTAAACNGVPPPLSCIFGSAPSFNNAVMTDGFLLDQAPQCNGVAPHS